MKNTIKVLGIIAIIAIIGFSMTACKDDDSDNGGGGGGGNTTSKYDYTGNSIADFATWLAAKPTNTADTAYTVKLNVSDLVGDSGTSGSLGNVLKTNTNKFVSIDLSESSITTFPYSTATGTFDGCSSLTGITIPNSVKIIGRLAFYGCNNLASITIPDSVTTIGQSTFTNCSNLASVTIGDRVSTIESMAFYSCSKLTSITIPESVVSLATGIFLGCTNLTNIKFEGTINTNNIANGVFLGDLRAKFYATDSVYGTPGTYTTTAPVGDTSVWTKN